MKKLTVLLCTLFSICNIYSQKYIRPVFDRTDNVSLHIDSVEFTRDSTFLYFTFDAIAGSWANISKESYIRDCATSKEYQIQSVLGIPFAPNRLNFLTDRKLLVRMSFQASKLDRFDFIENESDSMAFNIRGINLQDENDESASQSNLEKAASYSSRADVYSRLDDYKKAFELESEAMPIYKAILGKKSVRYAISVMNLASFSWKMGDYEKAINYGREDLSLCEFFYGKEHTTYAYSLSSLATYYQSAGDFIQSKLLNEEACKIIMKLCGDKSREYANTLIQLAKDYQGIGDIIQAIEYTEQSLAIANKEELSYLVNLNNLASLYAHLHQIERADSIEAEVVKLAKGVIGEHNSEYASYLGNLAGYKSLQGDYLKAIQLTKEALQIDKALGEKNPKYRRGLNNLAYIYSQSGEIDSALTTLHECINLYEPDDKINDRINFISILKSLSECYATKGEFLKAVSYSKDAIESLREYLGSASENMTNNEKYFFWQQYHGLFDDDFPYYVAMSKDDSLIPYLYDVILYSNSFSFKRNNVACSWHDIQNGLKEDDVAIEFISPSSKVGNIYFYALIQEKNTSPQLVNLFDLKDLEFALSQPVNKDSILAELLWKPILPHIMKYKRVFFSPTFVFNSIGIEYFPIMGNDYICDTIQMYRVSSTSVVLRMQQSSLYKNAVLFGNLNYDDENTQVVKDTDGESSSRGSYEPLPHTKSEITNIASLLQSKGIDCKLLSGNEGTEESFKTYSGQSSDIIHLATHGRYLNREKAEKEKDINNLSFISSEYDFSPMDKDKMLTRSFLLLSGGNRLIQRKVIPAGSNDGILTATEISKLDLSKTDLVVLSACESGLGDWSLDGGLMGLQRGFKEAGANTILMSLRKVDDEATQILMVEFYKNLMSGKSKHQSLKDAQKYLREVDNGKFDDPKYWAAFIMLDGLD